ncbi:MAG: SufD family Fe-S cluster assembly protein [Patescibacteria group bacterium]
MSNKEHITEISKTLDEPGWLLLWRQKRANIAGALPKTLKYGIGITGVLPQNTEGNLLQEPEGHFQYFDQITEYHVDATKGIELYTWKEAVTQEEIAPILQGLMESGFFPTASNYWSGLAQALFRSGLVVYVQPNIGDDGVSKEEKLTLDTVVPDGNSADSIVVIVKEGARIVLTSALLGPSSAKAPSGKDRGVFARTLVVLTERDAHVRVIQKQSLQKETIALVSVRGIVAAHSSVSWSEVFAGEIQIKSETENLLVGESARGEIMQGIIACGPAKFDVYSSAKHLADHTYSRIRAAGLGADTSRTVYRGLIDMKKGVRAVDGGQEAHFLVLSPKAEVDAIPSLDIASKEVSCTHKLSISHIRDTDTFYPKLRGLSDEESRRLFLESHFAQGFSGEENEEIMEEIRRALVQTIQGRPLNTIS